MGNTAVKNTVTPAILSLLGLMIVGLFGLYYSILIEMAENWKSNDNYSHGFFIPIISGYMIYSIRHDLCRMEVKPMNFGVLLLTLGLGILYVSSVGSELFLQRSSIIVVIFGIVLFLFGKEIGNRLLIPIGYLIFMVPLPAIIWNKIAFPLQLFSSAITEQIIRLLGIPIFREGNVLHLAQTTLEVVNACSGLRSLNTMFALSIALAWFATYGRHRKLILFLSAAPIAMLANIVRLTITASLASIYGEKVAQGFLHDFSGLFTFVFGICLLLLVSKILHSEKITMR